MGKIIFAGLILVFSVLCQAQTNEIASDIHASDFRWLQFNLMKSVGNKIPFGLQDDTYLEMEFGGRSGILELYGFLDVFDVFDSPDSDLHEGDNMFFKFQPRFSVNKMFGKDLSLGPIKEWYLATRFYVSDRALFEELVGLGTDMQVPWFGLVGVNLFARYIRENFDAANEDTWDGYMFSLNWYTPFYEVQNGGSVVYQGYLDYIFGANEIADDIDRTSSSLGWYNGLYWHTKRYAVGYGLKVYQNMALFKDGGIGGETSGVGQYFVLTYKF